jgi:hypothetical protein
MLRRHWGLLATAAVFAAGSASAQQVDIDTAKVEQMQRQMQQLQDQMKQVNKDIADAKRKSGGGEGGDSGGLQRRLWRGPQAVPDQGPEHPRQGEDHLGRLPSGGRGLSPA